MWSPPPIPVGAWSLASIAYFWPLHSGTLPQVCPEGSCKEKATVWQGSVGGLEGRQGSLGCPATSWVCRNKLQGQSRRENEVTKCTTGRESAKGGGVMPAPLGMADIGTGGGGGQRLQGTLPGTQAITGQGGPKNGKEKRGGEHGLRIKISPKSSGLILPSQPK